MTRMQKKTKKTDPIPTDKILEYNPKELRPIANRQIKSLENQLKWTGNSVYIDLINQVIKHEMGEVS